MYYMVRIWEHIWSSMHVCVFVCACIRTFVSLHVFAVHLGIQTFLYDVCTVCIYMLHGHLRNCISYEPWRFSRCFKDAVTATCEVGRLFPANTSNLLQILNFSIFFTSML